MKILVFGRTGQVATELARLLPGATFLGRAEADLSDPEACAAAIRANPADAIINAAAWTAVDKAETERAGAALVNAAAPGAMAREAAELGTPFLHISSDYVFDGEPIGRPRVESDPTGPVSVYGETKLEGERAVAAAGGPHVILRTAWVFSAHGRNFATTMLGLGRDREELRVVADQRGGPTSARDIAGALATIAEAYAAGNGRDGVFHYAGLPSVTWAEFADAIFEAAGWERRPRVTPITSAEWPTPARRPADSILDCSAIRAAYGIEQPDWRIALKDLIRETAA